MRNAELTRKRDKPKSQMNVWERAGEWQDLRDELARAIAMVRKLSRAADVDAYAIAESSEETTDAAGGG